MYYGLWVLWYIYIYMASIASCSHVYTWPLPSRWLRYHQYSKLHLLLASSYRLALLPIQSWVTEEPAFISLEMRLVEVWVSLRDPNIVFLYTRQAMIFISVTLGIAKITWRISGIEWLNNMVTVTRLTVAVVLQKDQLISWLSIRHKLGKY